VSELLGRTERWVRERLAELMRLGLLRVVPADELPGGVGGYDHLLELTVAGLTRLAASLGLSLASATRLHGFAGGGPDSAVGPRRALIRHLAHTLGTDAVFAAIATGARSQRGGALIEWQNAAACAHGRMRPDGYGLLRLGSRHYGFFLEFDRGTVRPAALRAKFASYHRYRVSSRAARHYDGFPTILVVTTGPGAEDRIIRALQAADVGQVARLPVLLTTTGLIETHAQGTFGSIWRSAECDRRLPWPAPRAA
jgi:hypothetical protein